MLRNFIYQKDTCEMNFHALKHHLYDSSATSNCVDESSVSCYQNKHVHVCILCYIIFQAVGEMHVVVMFFFIPYVSYGYTHNSVGKPHNRYGLLKRPSGI